MAAVLGVEDVLQVTYLEAFLRIKQLRSSSIEGFTAWLAKIAQNWVRDAVIALNSLKRPDPDRRLTARDPDDSANALLEVVGASEQLLGQ